MVLLRSNGREYNTIPDEAPIFSKRFRSALE